MAGLVNSGRQATASRPDQLYRASVFLLQPHVFDRKLNASVSVFAEQRDDDRDRSQGLGGDAALIYELGRFRTASLAYSLSTRRTFDFRLFFSTGTGVEIPTPLGPIQFSIGYKLNPSLFDLRDPQDVLDAARAGMPIEAVETNQLRRFYLHLTIGRSVL